MRQKSWIRQRRGPGPAAFGVAVIVALCLMQPAWSQAVDVAPQTTPFLRNPGTIPQAIPPVTSPIPRVIPEQQPQVLPPSEPPPVQVPAAVPAGPPLSVSDLRFEGISVYDRETLNELGAGAVGPSVPRDRLDGIVQALQTRYRTDGYVLTTVRGQLETVNGQPVFVVRALEGYISQVRIDGDIGPAASLAYKILEHLTWIRPVNNADLERYLLLVSDIPGVTPKAILRRGAEPGAVELVAQVSRKEFNALANFDNRGSDEAGPYQILLSGSSNSFTSVGEQIGAIIFNTFNREQIFGQVDGSAFIGADGLKLRAYFGKGNSKPGGALTGTGFNGDLSIGGAGLAYPLLRSRRLNLTVDGGLDFYDTEIDITQGGNAHTESHVRIFRTGVSFDFQDNFLVDLPGANVGALKFSKGLDALGANGAGDSGTRPGNRLNFTKLTGEFTRVQNLVTLGSVSTALKTSVGGQFTNDVLPPSEKFFLGGTRFGRGFYNGQVTGDRALGATVEFQVNTGFTDLPFLSADYRLPAQFYAFYDFGRGYNLGVAENDKTIQSVGVGVRSDLTSWLFLELEGVHRLVTQPSGANTGRLTGYSVYSRVLARY